MQQQQANTKEEPMMQVSLLHAAPDFFPVYQKLGYACIRSRWTQITIDTAKLHLLPPTTTTTTSAVVLRLARFPDDTPQLMTMHQHYSEQRFAGCIVRSIEYWNDYVSEELRGSLWVLLEEPSPQETTTSSSIVGCMSIQWRGDGFQLREFGCQSIANVPWVFHKLLSHLVQVQVPDMHPFFRLNLPTMVLEETQIKGNSLNFISAETENDDFGWMYKTLDCEGQGVGAKLDMPDITKSRPHLIWPTDSF
jgi:hypothetical protein